MEETITTVRLDHLGLFVEVAEQIGLVEIIDTIVGTDPREFLSTGQAVLAMCINGAGYTSRPQYLSPEFFEQKDLKFLLGPSRTQPDRPIVAADLNENKLGRSLDLIAKKGPDKIFFAVAMAAARVFKVNTRQAQRDSTTHSFYGEFKDAEGKPKSASVPQLHDPNEFRELILTKGYSKDARAECVQFVQELMVSSDGGIPLATFAHSGNASDAILAQEAVSHIKKTFAEVNAEDLMPEILVEDCKFFSDATIKTADKEGLFWISRAPNNITEVGQTVEKALADGHWVQSPLDPKRVYQEYDVERAGLKLRFLVVQSDSSIKRAEAQVQRKVTRDAKLWTAEQKRFGRQLFHCKEDLETALAAKAKAFPLHIISSPLIEEVITGRSRGRPKAGAPEGTRSYRLKDVSFSENTDAIQRASARSACFVIATNMGTERISAPEVIKAYVKDQQLVERGFRLGKDTRFFCEAFFLKSVARINALSSVMTLTLLLHLLLQRQIRKALEKGDVAPLPDQKKRPTRNPTQRWINQKFEGVDVIRRQTSKGPVYIFQGMTEFVQHVLHLLGPPFQRRYSAACLS